MFIHCMKCKVVYCVDDDYKKRYMNGDIKFHCNMCGCETFDVAM